MKQRDEMPSARNLLLEELRQLLITKFLDFIQYLVELRHIELDNVSPLFQLIKGCTLVAVQFPSILVVQIVVLELIKQRVGCMLDGFEVRMNKHNLLVLPNDLCSLRKVGSWLLVENREVNEHMVA